MIDAVEIGLQLTQARKDRKMSQARLAELSGVSEVYIGYIEQGRRGVPTWDTLAKLCDALELECHVILSRKVAVPPPPPVKPSKSMTAEREGVKEAVMKGKKKGVKSNA